MSKLSKLASAMPFAHYLGLGGSAAAVAQEDDERKQGDDESDEDYAKRMEELDDEEEKARKAEEEKEKEAARKVEEEKKEKEAKRAKADDDDDDDADMEDDDEEGKRAGRAKGARQRERVRCARIVAEGIKLGRVKQACVFAFDSKLSPSAAIAALNAAALDEAPKTTARRPSIDERMAAVKTANPGASAGAAPSADPAQAAADRIIAAGERARGGK